MLGLYFSGTGNTEYCLEQFLKALDSSAECISIEEASAGEEILKNDVIIFAYPIYYSNLPKIVRDFIVTNQKNFSGKRIFIMVTMGLFSGDGAGCSGRLFSLYGAKIMGGLHLKMPDCISDEKVLKKTIEQNKAIVKEAEATLKKAAEDFKNETPPQTGLGFLPHMAGLFGQRLWFYHKTKNYSDQLKIDVKKCVGCGLCVKLCPLKNLELVDKKAQAKKRCTLCYRCVNNCPYQAITLLGKKIYEQCRIERYL